MTAQLVGEMFQGLWIVLVFWGGLLAAAVVLIAGVMRSLGKRRQSWREQHEWLDAKRRELESDLTGRRGA